MDPAAAGTHAYLLAALLGEAVRVDAGEDGWAGVDRATARRAPGRDPGCLPDFVAEHDGQPFRALVRRFLAGERATGAATPATPATDFSDRPMNPAQTRLRLRQLAACGVDLGLLRGQLARTPEERIEAMLALAHTGRLLRAAVSPAPGGADG